MTTTSFPVADSIGETSVLTFLDESKGMHAYRTQVSRAKSKLKADIWSTVADTPEQAARNHAAGLVQAAVVELDAWLQAPSTGAVPARIARACDVLGVAHAELVQMRSIPTEQAVAKNRELATQRLVELDTTI